MSDDVQAGLPTAVVVMGVSGSGKSTVARRLSHRLGWPFVEADDLHPEANVAKMAAGTPLTDADREPWLRLVRDRVDELGTDVVVTCSALRRSYRDVLRTGRARVRFVHLAGTADLLGARMGARTDHFMPASLLTSQIDTLEPLEADEDGVVLDVARRPGQLVDAAVAALGLPAPARTVVEPSVGLDRDPA
jgi:gluconokinase